MSINTYTLPPLSLKDGEICLGSRYPLHPIGGKNSEPMSSFKLVAVDGKPVANTAPPNGGPSWRSRIVSGQENVPLRSTQYASSAPSRARHAPSKSADIIATPLYDKFTKQLIPDIQTLSLQSNGNGNNKSYLMSDRRSRLSHSNPLQTPDKDYISAPPVPEKNFLRSVPGLVDSPLISNPGFKSSLDYSLVADTQKLQSLRDAIDVDQQELRKLEMLAASIPSLKRQLAGNSSLYLSNNSDPTLNSSAKSTWCSSSTETIDTGRQFASLKQEYALLKRNNEATKSQLEKYKLLVGTKDSEIKRLKAAIASNNSNAAELARYKEENLRLEIHYKTLVDSRKEHAAKVERDLAAIKLHLEVLNKQRLQDSERLRQLDMRIQGSQVDRNRLSSLQNDMDRIHEKLHAESERIRTSISASDQSLMQQVVATEQLAKRLPLVR